VTATTANFALPYPTGSDAPCDFAEQWCDFTEAIDGVLGRFQTGIDRAIPVIPAALIRASTPRTANSGQNIAFDEVVLDTAGMTDLDANPYAITITRPGRYSVGGYIEKPSSGVVDSQLTLFVVLGSNWSILDRGVGFVYSIPSYTPVVTLAAGDQVTMFFNVPTLGPQTVDVAWLCVFWHSDTEASV